MSVESYLAVVLLLFLPILLLVSLRRGIDVGTGTPLRAEGCPLLFTTVLGIQSAALLFASYALWAAPPDIQRLAQIALTLSLFGPILAGHIMIWRERRRTAGAFAPYGPAASAWLAFFVLVLLCAGAYLLARLSMATGLV